MEPSTFQLYKIAGVAGAFGIASAIQALRPYRGSWREILENWKNNLPLGLLGSVVMGVICGGCVCVLSERMRSAGFGLLNWVSLAVFWQILISVLILDFTAYLWHRANHRVPFLWRFHAVHHSDTVFEASTAVRFHPGELLISLTIRMLVVAVFGLPVMGLLIFELVYAFFNFVEHGNIRAPKNIESVWGRVFISPALHRKHHSVKKLELNTNFGTIFSFWDRGFKTLMDATSEESISVGLPDGTRRNGLWNLILLPIWKTSA